VIKITSFFKDETSKVEITLQTASFEWDRSTLENNKETTGKISSNSKYF